MRDLRPHFSIRITETGGRTQPLGIGQPQRGSIAVSVPSKPTFVCVPSQNGLLFE
jgi:hypothetical protein